MFIGVDIGGTHADAVIALPGKVYKTAKVPTTPEDIFACTRHLLSLLLEEEQPSLIKRVCVSSTLGINALLTGKNDPVGMLAVPGPGMKSLDFWENDPLFIRLDGSQDHRGVITQPISTKHAKKALQQLRDAGAKAIALIAKFSPKNPEVEEELRALAAEVFPMGTPLVIGSSVSGSLHFPRRIHTAWCRAALMRRGTEFVTSLEQTMRQLGLTCPLSILKADAGTFSAKEAALDPASSMGSGPAGGMLGFMAFSPKKACTLMLDIGGTTTDISLLMNGEPLLEQNGMNVGNRPTLIRSLLSKSIAIGGDSALHFLDGVPAVGPMRLGKALCFSSEHSSQKKGQPTLIDALNVLELASLGDVHASKQGLASLLAENPTCASDPKALAQLFVDKALLCIHKACEAFIASINERPVYTIREVLVDTNIAPEQIAIIGTPAKLLAPLLERIFTLPIFVPDYHGFANAVGAALALPTRMAELYADTLLGKMSIPSLGISKSIAKRYSLDEAKKDLTASLKAVMRDNEEIPPYANEASASTEDLSSRHSPIHIVFEESFSMISDNGNSGKIFRVGAQLPAGIIRILQQHTEAKSES